MDKKYQIGIRDKKSMLYQCVEAAISTRDFCGDERAAIIQTCQDYGFTPCDATIDAVMVSVDKEWRKYQRAAGAVRK